MVAYTQLAAPVDITPTADGTFKEIDVTANVTNASGVLIRVQKVSLANDEVAIRKKGSTDNIGFNTEISRHTYLIVGIDASDIFEMRLQSSGGAWIVLLIGYFDSTDFKFFTNVLTLTPTVATWVDWDISTDTGGDTAIAAVCFARNASDFNRQIGYRKKGSTDTRLQDVAGNEGEDIGVGCPIIGCDGSEVFQVYRETTSVGDMYCIGYAVSGVTMNTNAVNRSLSSTGSWIDLAGDAKEGVFVEIINTAAASEAWGMRPDGDADFDHYDQMVGFHTWTTVGAISTIVEGKIQSTNIDFYVTGTIDADVVGGLSIPVAMHHYQQQRAG